MLKENLSPDVIEEIVVLSGPSHAEEVVLHHPTTITAACGNLEMAEKFKICL